MQPQLATLSGRFNERKTTEHVPVWRFLVQPRSRAFSVDFLNEAPHRQPVGMLKMCTLVVDRILS